MTDQSDSRDPGAPDEAGKTLHRRNLLAGGVAAAGAALAALAGAQRASAGHDTSNPAYAAQEVMHVDATNTTAGSTRISSNISGTAAFVALNNYPVGISRPDGILGRTMYTTSNAAGVAGTSEAADGGIGMLGCSKAATGTGIYGFSGSVVPSEVPPAGTGVHGTGPVNGVSGKSTSGIGVRGQSTSASGVEGVAITGTGVKGQAEGAGVHGVTDAGTGVKGEADEGVGVHGVAGTAGIAGKFTGRTLVEGQLQTASLEATGNAHVGGTLAVDGATTLAGATINGQTTLAALTVKGPTTFGGAVALPDNVALGQAQLDRLALPKTSGRAVLARAAASITISNVPLGAGTLVLATLQSRRKGLFIEAAVPNVARGRVTVYFNKKAPKGTRVAWLLAN